MALEPISMTLWKADSAAFVASLGRSFREIGFAVIKDHGLDKAMIDEALGATKTFFALPKPTKLTYFDENGGGQRGYVPFGTESAKGEDAIDLKEFWHVGRRLPEGSKYAAIMGPNPACTHVPGFDEATYGLFEALDTLGQTILVAVARHLGLDDAFFTERVAVGNSILRLLHYPPQKEAPPAGSIRAAAHEDINVLTLLLGAEEPGLQVFNIAEQRWIDVAVPEGALVLNCGDMLQRLTNKVLPSTTHRVLNPTAARANNPRYSTPYFLHFAPDVLIETLPQCVAETGTSHFPEPITAHDYLIERLIELGLIKLDK